MHCNENHIISKLSFEKKAVEINICNSDCKNVSDFFKIKPLMEIMFENIITSLGFPSSTTVSRRVF